MASKEPSSKPWLLDEVNQHVFWAALATLTLATGCSALILKRVVFSNRVTDGGTTDRDTIRSQSLVQSALASLHLLRTSRDPRLVDAPTHAEDKDGTGGTTSDAAAELNKERERLKNSARSKERRKRGKDPFKEITKNGKKLKDILRQSQPKRPNTASSDDGQPPPLPLPESLYLHREPKHSSARTSDDHERDRDHEDEVTPKPSPPSTSTAGAESTSHESSFPHATVATPPSPPASSYMSESILSLPDPSHPAIDIGSSTVSSSSAAPSITSTSASASSSHLAPTTWTNSSSWVDISSPNFNSNPAGPSNQQQSQPQQRNSKSRSRSRNPGTNPNSSWDWDGQSPFYKDPPPRFKAAAVNGNGSSVGVAPLPLTPQSIPASLPISPASSPSKPSFPSITSASASSRSVNHVHRTPTPRSTNTPPPHPPSSAPPGNVNGVALSTQTQIASLKGALEAAKMREEKMRGEVERLGKEVEGMRWKAAEEVGGWRRREAEVRSPSLSFILSHQRARADGLIFCHHHSS